MFSVSVATLFFYHVWLTVKNRSTIGKFNLVKKFEKNLVESFRAPLFTYGEDKNGFNLGWSANWREVFGDNRLHWFLPLPTR
jgi:palmitoyltransferase